MSHLPWEKRPEIELTPQDAIARYRALGFALVPLRERSKFPTIGDWQNNPVQPDDDQRLKLFGLNANIGINHYFSRTGTLDVDWLAATERLFREFGFDYDALMQGYPRIRTREGKDKILFRMPAGMERNESKHVLRWPDESGECDAQGRPIMVTVLELRTGKSQDVLPPSIHPDTNAPYEWHTGQAPWDYPELPTLPEDHFLVTIWREWDRFLPQLINACPWAQSDPTPPIPEPVRHLPKGAHMDIIGQFNRSLSVETLLERNDYRKRGKRWLAPFSKTKIPGVVVLSSGKTFSHHGSDVLCTGHAHDAFSLLTILECSGSIDVAVNTAARELGINRHDPVNTEIDFEAFVANVRKRQAKSPAPRVMMSATVKTPDQALIDQAPAWVASFLEWGLATAAKPLPHLTLQAAFTTLSAAASRRYRSNLNNWPSLWFLNVEVTASGKEHPESLVEIALEKAGLGSLLAGSGYTSPGAIFSVLLDRPAHVALIDEFGKLMQSSQAKGNQHKADAITLLMQAFSSCHKTIRPPAYSAMGATKEQRETLASRKVCNPGIVLMASTTPGTFYNSLDRQWIDDGFLGRFILCNSTVGRQKSVRAERCDPPAALVETLATIACRRMDTDAPLQVQGLETTADQPANPIEMIFSAEAERGLDAFESDLMRRMNDAQHWGLDPLYGRTREKAMRLAMLCALAEGPERREIGATDLDYAIAYVSSMDAQLVETAKLHVADSPFSRIKNTCLVLIQGAGKRGLTARELERKSAAFNALKPKDQQDVLGALHSSGLVAIETSSGPSGRGRKRMAWVAVEDEAD